MGLFGWRSILLYPKNYIAQSVALPRLWNPALSAHNCSFKTQNIILQQIYYVNSEYAT